VVVVAESHHPSSLELQNPENFIGFHTRFLTCCGFYAKVDELHSRFRVIRDPDGKTIEREPLSELAKSK